MRKYNSERNDHAIIAVVRHTAMQAIGYTQNSGRDWLSYVDPNATGNTPSIQ